MNEQQEAWIAAVAAMLIPMRPIPIAQVPTHRPDKCAGGVCAIHNPSDHPMRSFAQFWRQDRGIVERRCPCGTDHPDPDDLRVKAGDDVHGCCARRCCAVLPEVAA